MKKVSENTCSFRKFLYLCSVKDGQQQTTFTAELFDILDTGDNRITHAGAMPA